MLLAWPCCLRGHRLSRSLPPPEHRMKIASFNINNIKRTLPNLPQPAGVAGGSRARCDLPAEGDRCGVFRRGLTLRPRLLDPRDAANLLSKKIDQQPDSRNARALRDNQHAQRDG